MRYFDWSEEKNQKLIEQRGVRFEDVIVAIDEERLIEIIKHPNQKKYPDQRIFIVSINKYCYLVPFIETEEKVFLKTIIPDRKATKKYLKKGNL
jgi:uncharacterized DUF497 family protein